MAEPNDVQSVDKMALVMQELLNKECKGKRKRAHSEVINEDSNRKADTVNPVSVCHLPPDPSFWTNEKHLKRLATKGVVQLFNAVNKQQKEIKTKLDDAGSSETKRSKIIGSVDKRQFLEMLKGQNVSQKTSSLFKENDNE